MGVSRRSRVPERITRPDERFDSSQVGYGLLEEEAPEPKQSLFSVPSP